MNNKNKLLKRHEIMEGPYAGSFINRATLPFTVTAYQRSSTVYNIFIQDEIDSSEDFLDAITALNMADADDEVIIHLSSPGGSVDAVDTFLMEMASCKANIIVKATGTVASAATLILLSADESIVSNACNLLFHSASFGMSGKVQDVYEYTNFTKTQTEKLLREYYEGFFTESELHDIFVNKREFWMGAEEFGIRCDRQMLAKGLIKLKESSEMPSLVLENEVENDLIDEVGTDIA
jgi:ATP-dependent protease ClpP protease subunit